MATVKITKELTKRTEGIVNTMREKELLSLFLEKDFKVSGVDASDLYNRIAWGTDKMHLIKEMPDGWIRRVEVSDILVTDEAGDDSGVLQLHSISLFDMRSAFIRPTAERFGGQIPKITVAELAEIPDHIIGVAELRQAVKNCEARLSIRKRWEGVSTKVSEFLAKCSTLNEAVKIYPAVRMYIHVSDLERLDRKVDKSAKSKEVIENIDFDALTAAAVASKIS